MALLTEMPLALGDHGVVYPYFAPPAGQVRPPARIRYANANEHVFYRAARSEYVSLCQELVASEHFAGERYCIGDNLIGRRARSIIKSGNPTDWVASDTNHHLETVSEQAWRRLEEVELLDRFSLSEPERRPWLQQDLDASADR